MSQLWANVAVSRLFSAPLRSPFRSPSPSWGTQMASETKAESLVKQAGAENTEGGRACRSQLPVKWGEGERTWEVAGGRAMASMLWSGWDKDEEWERWPCTSADRTGRIPDITSSWLMSSSKHWSTCWVLALFGHWEIHGEVRSLPDLSSHCGRGLEAVLH